MWYKNYVRRCQRHHILKPFLGAAALPVILGDVVYELGPTMSETPHPEVFLKAAALPIILMDVVY